ncbi:hypothetical protein KEM48_005047 [Puccinia striiformis f. sp. tritici PST-130]|nr:hypothetical protein KEM48_005047 [Puccinia striiformis f. sp. tritici PST-130]
MACVKGASRAGAMMRREDQDGDGDEDMKYGGNRSVIEFSDGIMVGKGAPDIQEGQEEGKAVILYPITPSELLLRFRSVGVCVGACAWSGPQGHGGHDPSGDAKS